MYLQKKIKLMVNDTGVYSIWGATRKPKEDLPSPQGAKISAPTQPNST